MAEKKYVGPEGLRGIKKYIADSIPDVSGYITAEQLQRILENFVTKDILGETAGEVVRMVESGEIGPFQGYPFDHFITFDIENMTHDVNGDKSGWPFLHEEVTPELCAYITEFANSPRIWDKISVSVMTYGLNVKRPFPLPLVFYLNYDGSFYAVYETTITCLGSPRKVNVTISRDESYSPVQYEIGIAIEDATVTLELDPDGQTPVIDLKKLRARTKDSTDGDNNTDANNDTDDTDDNKDNNDN